MYELVKCMLSISARLPPHNRTRGVVHARTTARHGLAVRLHVTLIVKHNITVKKT